MNKNNVYQMISNEYSKMEELRWKIFFKGKAF
jgi:hypothetical protein